MKKIILTTLILLFVIVLTGCQTQKCPELDCSQCPQIKCPDLDCSNCPKQIETKTVTKYQCSDGSVKDSLGDCPEKEIPKSIKLTGTGDRVTEKFYLKSGLTKISGTYQGEGNFIVHLYDEYGNKEYLFNEIGTYYGEQIQSITQSGYYLLDIKGGGYTPGSWTIEIKQ